MSGVKTYSVRSGASANAAASMGALATTAVAGGVAIVAGAAVLAVMATANAAKAYMERKERERQAILDREAAIQQKIASLRQQSQSQRKPIAIGSVQTEQKTEPKVTSVQAVSPRTNLDQQRQVRELVTQLLQIKKDYENLQEQGYLDATSFETHWAQVEAAAQQENLNALRSGLRALDDARIQVMQSLQQQWAEQFQYVEERLNALNDRLPQAVSGQLRDKIKILQTNSQNLTENDLLDLHQQITEVEIQADRALTAAQDLMKAWQDAGYVVQMLPGTDDGDVEIEIETHEGANTRMRVQYYGQQLDFFGPQEESASCAARTQEALRLFQEQGYQLEWTSWDGQPVPEEWRYVYSAQPEEDQAQTPPSALKPARRMEQTGY